MANEFVTVATCRFEMQAEGIRLLLEQENIPAFVVDANAVMVNWFWAPALGYIKVQVPREQVEAARSVLQRHPQATDEIAAAEAEDAPPRCLACGEPMPDDADRCPKCGWTFTLGAEQDEPGAPAGPCRYAHAVPYQADVQAALDELRRSVFESGQFDGAELKAATPDAALELAGAEGTRSILDITAVADEPEAGRAAPLTREELIGYFGTEHPTDQAVREAEEFWDDLEAGQARYVVIYDGDAPKQILFAGCSFA